MGEVGEVGELDEVDGVDEMDEGRGRWARVKAKASLSDLERCV